MISGTVKKNIALTNYPDMDQGRIVEQGSYDELMEKDGHFARFARRNML